MIAWQIYASLCVGVVIGWIACVATQRKPTDRVEKRVRRSSARFKSGGIVPNASTDELLTWPGKDQGETVISLGKEWRGCPKCYGSGGPRRDPCHVCAGTGKLWVGNGRPYTAQFKPTNGIDKG